MNADTRMGWLRSRHLGRPVTGNWPCGGVDCAACAQLALEVATQDRAPQQDGGNEKR